MKKAFLLLSVLGAMTLTGCNFIKFNSTGDFMMVRGSENVITKTLDLGEFNALSMSISADVVYSEVTEASTVVVSAPDNLFEYFDFCVEDGTLKLRYDKNANIIHDRDVIITVTGPTLKKVTLAGSGDFRALAPITASTFVGAISGSGDMSFAGITAGEANFSIGGSGNLKATGLDCGDLTAAIAGSGDMVLAGKADTATIAIAGSGDVDIRSLTANDVKTSVAGSGDIRR